MSFTYTLNNAVIPDADIISYGKDEQDESFNGENLIAATCNVELDDINKDDYNPLYVGSLLYGIAWWNKEITIYDDDNGVYIWKGRLKKITNSWSSNKLSIKSSNYIQDAIDTICVYNNTGNKTPAQIIYELLNTNLEVPDSYINYSGFQGAINIQTASTVYTKVVFTKEDSKNILQVIEELCRITQCVLYVVNNIIHLWQFEEYAGMIGFGVKNRDIISKSFKFETIEDKIVNDYSVAYDAGANIALKTDSDSSSQDNYGVVKSFLVPNEDIDSTLVGDFKILFLNIAAATWAGALAVTRYKNILYQCKFVLDNVRGAWSFLELNDQLGLNFYPPFIREPIRVTKLVKDNDKDLILVTAVFLNLPVNVYARDVIPPTPIELRSVIGSDRQVLIKWSQSAEADHLGYYIYFTSTPGEWESEFCNAGRSRIDVKNPDTTPDGYAYITLSELNNGTEYYVKVTSYDTSFNESEDSNILSAVPFAGIGLLNMYMIQGDPYLNTLTLDATNAEAGTVPDEFTIYDDFDIPEFDNVITAIYESERFYKIGGLTSIEWKAIGDANDIKFQYRTYDGTDWGSWSTRIDAIGLHSIDISGASYFQYRFVFYSPSWADSDYVIVRDIL